MNSRIFHTTSTIIELRNYEGSRSTYHDKQTWPNFPSLAEQRHKRRYQIQISMPLILWNGLWNMITIIIHGVEKLRWKFAWHLNCVQCEAMHIKRLNRLIAKFNERAVNDQYADLYTWDKIKERTLLEKISSIISNPQNVFGLFKHRSQTWIYIYMIVQLASHLSFCFHKWNMNNTKIYLTLTRFICTTMVD